MKVDKHKKRLNAIKFKYVFFTTKCKRCGEEFKHEKMWQFNRNTGVNDGFEKWHYCPNCMHSAEEVLDEIDTDEHPYGIALIDNDTFSKKDSTRMNLAIPRVSRHY